MMMLPSIFGENLFDDFFENPFGKLPAARGNDLLYGKHSNRLMKTDVRELENAYEIDMELPGFKKEQVKVDVKDGYMTVSAVQEAERNGADNEEKHCRYLRRERYVGQCSRSFYVGEGIEPEDVHARFEDGVLKISLPKAEQKKPVRSSSVIIE